MNKINEFELEKLSKKDLLRKIQALEAHNNQLKHIIAKGHKKETIKKARQKPFDFTKCSFRHILLKICYFGWNYCGFVVQEDTPNTIEHHLFDALDKTCLIKDRSSSNYHRCGRTDKGVSANGQVISISVRSRLTKETINNTQEEIDYCKILNNVLPADIKCIAWQPVPDNFSARFNCKFRTYKYFFPKGNLNIKNMEEAAYYLIGTHDFRNFCKMDVANGVSNFVRNIINICIEPFDETSKLLNEYSMMVITIKAEAFLWHQIRCIMAVLLLVGQNKENPIITKQLLNIAELTSKPDYNMASELPLTLYSCIFDDIGSWITTNDTLLALTESLRKMWIHFATKSALLKIGIDEFEKNLTNSIKPKCLTEEIIPIKCKKHVPLLKRPRCDSLETKIEKYKKKGKLTNRKEL